MYSYENKHAHNVKGSEFLTHHFSRGILLIIMQLGVLLLKDLGAAHMHQWTQGGVGGGHGPSKIFTNQPTSWFERILLNFTYYTPPPKKNTFLNLTYPPRKISQFPPQPHDGMTIPTSTSSSHNYNSFIWLIRKF